MIRNERGFVLPFTLTVVTIVIFFFLHQVNVYMLEKMYYKETEGVMTLDYLVEMTVYRIKKDIYEGITGDREFTIKFAEGTAAVQITGETNQEPHIFHVDILCTTNSAQQYRAAFTYDSDVDSISNWDEAG